MTEVKNGEDLPPISRQVLSLLEMAHTTFSFFFQYLSAAQDIFLRGINQYRGALYRSFGKGCSKGYGLMKKAIFLNVMLFFLSLIVLMVLIGCLLSAMGTTMALRYYMLRHIPGSHVMSLDFNTMPFYTEWWRNKPIDESALTHLPLSTQERPVGHSRLEGNQSGRIAQYYPEAVELAYADMKFSLLNRYRNSVLATSTMLLSSGPTQEVFLPDGDVNLEAIFQLESPIFNAKAEYFGKIQFVFLREEVGRDVTVVVESTMLLAEDAHLPQPLATLDVVFRKYVSLNVRTGDSLDWWPIRIAKCAFKILFYGPVKGSQILRRMYIDATAAPFPRINHDREVAVTVSLYNRFAPPLSLQSRLRAMNITVYQNPDEESSGSLKRVKLLRMTFYSFLELHGIVGWLARRPVISFAFLTLLVFIFLCGVTFLVCTALVLTLFRKFKFSAPEAEGFFGSDPSKPRGLKQPLAKSHLRNHLSRTGEGNPISPFPLEEDEFRHFLSHYSLDYSEEERPGGPSSRLRKDQ